MSQDTEKQGISMHQALRDILEDHPNQNRKYVRRRHQLERMRAFYEDKAPEAPKNQGRMFMGFVEAITYFLTIGSRYNKLVSELEHLLIEGESNDDTDRDTHAD